MRRRLAAIASAAVFAAGTLVVSAATQAQAAHRCDPELPCYPHVCVDIKQKPYVTFCGG